MTQIGHLQQLLGKQITGIVLKESDASPRSQLFLLFDDGTHFEFYSSFDKIVPTKGLWPHQDGQTVKNVRAYMGDKMRIVEEVYLEGPAEGIGAKGGGV
jgi:hypothetical protein